VYVYVPEEIPDNDTLVPVPVEVVPPGEAVKVQFPAAGKLFRITLPAAVNITKPIKEVISYSGF
jgi:hypothetical protein